MTAPRLRVRRSRFPERPRPLR